MDLPLSLKMDLKILTKTDNRRLITNCDVTEQLGGIYLIYIKYYVWKGMHVLLLAQIYSVSN